MKTFLAPAALAFLCALPAHAGNAGAGPGGTGSLASGTVIAPDALSAALFDTTDPGQVGTIRLGAAEAQEAFAYLSQQPGAVVTGTRASADGTFPDGGGFRVVVDTADGTLTLSRR